MEYAFPHMLGAEELRRILQERELIIPNLQSMDYEELLKIFNKFAVPLEKRGDRKQAATAKPTQLVSTHKRILPPPVSDCAAKLSRVTLNINLNGTQQRKRKTEEPIGNTVSTKSCKRTKITWP